MPTASFGRYRTTSFRLSCGCHRHVPRKYTLRCWSELIPGYENLSKRIKIQAAWFGRSAAATILLSVVAGCAQVQSATDQAGRDAAKTIMPQTFALYFPQIPKEFFAPFTDCVVDNALAVEVRSLAEDAVVGVDQGTADTVQTILERPQPQTCLTDRIGSDAVPVVQ